MFQFRQDAMKQDRSLKEQCEKLFSSRGMKLPTTNIITRKDKSTQNNSKASTSSTTNSENTLGSIHSSITNLFRQYPSLRLPRKCFSDDMSPFVSIELGQVERYFRKRKIDMMKYVYHPISLNTIAKKRTTPQPTKVAPLKISKKILENYKNLSLGELKKNVLKVSSKTKNRRRRRSSSSETTTQSSSSMETRISNNRRRHRKSTEIRNARLRIATLSSSSSNNNEEGYTSEDTQRKPTSKPTFVETLGLTTTPTLSSDVPANICGSIQYSDANLKPHNYKHNVCQFCKHKFLSIEAKAKHIQNDCDVKKMINLEKCTVILEKIDSVLDIRRKYQKAFEGFESIPGLNDPQAVEEITLTGTSMTSDNKSGDIIVLSEDDEQQPLENNSHENDSLSITQLSNISIDTSTEDSRSIAYSTVSDLKPDIRIKNNSVFDQINSETPDTHVISQLLNIMKVKKVAVEKMVHINLPRNEDIKTNTNDCTSELRNLRIQLRIFKVPIEMKKGSFSVNYKFRENAEPTRRKDLWYNIPLKDYKPGTNQYSNQHIRYPAANSPPMRLQQNKYNYNVNGASANLNLTGGNHAPVIQNPNSLPNDNPSINLISNYFNKNSLHLIPPNIRLPVSGNNPLPASSSCSAPKVTPLISLSTTNMPSSVMSATLPINPVNAVAPSLNVNSNSALNDIQRPPTQSISGFRVKNVWELQ